MMTLPDSDVLRKLAEWIVPPDDSEPVGGKAALPYVMREIGTGAASAFLPEMNAFLAKLSAADFLALSSDAQEKLLLSYATEPAFIRLAELVQEGFYSSPEGLAMVGFQPVRMEAL